MSDALPRHIGIIGYGQTLYAKKTDRTLISLLWEAGRRALASSGLAKAEIDGLAVCSFELPPDNAVTFAEQIGLSVSWAYLGTAGGAGPVASVVNAVASDRGRPCGGRAVHRRGQLRCRRTLSADG